MCSSDPPPAPDYVGAANAQGAANVDAARVGAKLSNPNIIGPYGTQTVTYDGDTPTVTQSLTPEAQATLEAQQRVQHSLADLGQQGVGTAQSVLGSAFTPTTGPLQTSVAAPGQVQKSYDTSGLAQMPVNAGTTGQEAIMARLQPQIERNRQLDETRLRNQGLVPGGEAYDADVKARGQQENDLYSQAALQGINLDTAARAQGFNELQAGANLNNTGVAQEQNQNIAGANFGNAANQQELQRQLALRGQPLNEITALMSGSQIQTPQFQQYQGQNVQAAPTFAATQAQAGNALQNYGIQQGANNSTMGGLYNLAGTGAMLGGLYAMR
jgi:hypothetical protein